MDLGILQDGVTDGDANPTNEQITNIALLGTTLTITGSGGGQSVDLISLQDGVTDGDADPTNERDTALTLVGTTLTIIDSGGGKSVDLSGLPRPFNIVWVAKIGGDTTLLAPLSCPNR